MKYYIFRNTTVERFFANFDAGYSGYGDISFIPECDRYIWWYFAPIKADNKRIADEIYSYMDSMRLTLSRIPAGKNIMLFTISEIFGMHTILSDRSVSKALSDYNGLLWQMAKEDSRVEVVDFTDFTARYPASDLMDWRYFFTSQMALNPKLAEPFMEWLSGRIEAAEAKRKKCLVMDLDNTLWGGVLGEDGIAGVALGGDYPGKAFSLFQELIRELGRQGVMLAVCSKNNMEDVREMWNSHPDAVLKEDSFVALKINWTNKADNIKQLSEELNIGLDSMVFIDDNPTERRVVAMLLPEVTVPEFPEQPYMLPAFMKYIGEKYFSLYALTKEDLSKTEQYQANLLRANLKVQFTDLKDYIRDLEITLDIKEANEVTIPRAAQMTQKTNQFNLTSRRYTDADIRSMLLAGYKIYTLAVRDRFGDSGISGLCILKTAGSTAHIDSFLMSCRVLGKDIEYAFIASLLKRLQADGIITLTAEFIPSPKNIQVADFYKHAGFKETLSENGIKHYAMHLNETQIDLPENYNYQ